MCLARGSAGADPTPGDIQDRLDEHKATISATEQKIAESKEEIARLAEKAAPIMEEIEGLNFQLNTLQGRARSMRSLIDRLDKEMASTRQTSHLLEDEMRALETYVAKRLVAFHKLSRLGIGPILFAGTSLFETQQRMMALQRILDQDAHTWQALQSKKSYLDGLEEKMNAQKREQRLLLARCDKETSSITQKRAQRAVLLKKIQNQKTLAQEAVRSLMGSAKELDEAVQSLKQGRVATRKGSGGGPFLAQKGALPMPTRGDLVAFFGPYENEGPYNVKGFRNGVNIKAEPGAPVQAVWNGQVIYSDWFKGYGNIVIIDHGAHYYTLSAQLDQVLKKKGDRVASGDRVGTVGDTATHGGPGLYFEIRHRGKPLDPTFWLRN
jgi:septal ring factor EnvC (AmiA/AmiB activator)